MDEVLEGAGAPQMPALAFSLAMLARLGPLFVPVLDFWMPALALAVDHNEPKASPEDFLAAAEAGLLAVLEGEAREDMEGVVA